MTRTLLLVSLASLCFGQSEPAFVVPPPPASALEIRKDIVYRQWNGENLVLDLYRPARRTPDARLPVIIFMNGFGSGSQRAWPQYTGFASVFAGEGFAAINPDTHTEGIEDDLEALLAAIRAHAADWQVDPDRVVVFACSGHVERVLPFLEDAKRPLVAGGIVYYGIGMVRTWRPELPMLFVRAGLDRPFMNNNLDKITALGQAANAPIQVINVPGGHHGFDVMDHNDTSREAVAATVQFARMATSPGYRAALRAGLTEVNATGALQSGQFETAARLYASLVDAHPDSGPLQLSYGEALTGAGRYREALEQFTKAKGKAGVGPRDVGLPASRTAALAKDADKTIAWLKSIPQRFLPVEALQDPAYQFLAENPEFKALLARK